MTNHFLITVVFIFLTALIGTVLRRRRRDLCLKDFEDFQVSIELKDGSVVWGKLVVYPQDIELLYAQAHLDERGHREFSYVLFSDRVSEIQAIYRHHDELTEKHQKLRRREINRAWKPNIFRRGWRGFRNLLNTFGDAFNKSVGVGLSAAGERGGQIVSTQDKHLQEIGTTVLGAVANAYEPVLESYIGRRVVIEELRGTEWVEHEGVLKEYSAQWIELLDGRDEEDSVFRLQSIEQLRLNRDIDFVVRKVASESEKPALSIQIENHGRQELVVKRVTASDYQREVDLSLPPGGVVEQTLEDLPASLFTPQDYAVFPDEVALRGGSRMGDGLTEIPLLPNLEVVVQGTREVDRLLPRSRAVLRHGGESR